jgi:hypothetical protein
MDFQVVVNLQLFCSESENLISRKTYMGEDGCEIGQSGKIKDVVMRFTFAVIAKGASFAHTGGGGNGVGRGLQET